MPRFFCFAWTVKTRSTIRMLFILYFVYFVSGVGVGVDQEPGDGVGVGVGTAPPRLRTPGFIHTKAGEGSRTAPESSHNKSKAGDRIFYLRLCSRPS